MFGLWRKLDVANSAYIRPHSNFSSKSLVGFNQISVVESDAVDVKRDHGALEMSFKSATSPLQVLRKLPSNPADYRKLAGETVFRALQTITVLQRANKETIKCDFITLHENFEQLCRRLKRCSAMYNTDELVKSLKCLISLGVPTNSEISLILLNLIKHEINNMALNEIIYLDFVLGQTECRSELQKTIQSSLPIVFGLQVSQQIDKENSVAELISTLNYLASHKIDAENANMKIIFKVLCDKCEEISSQDAINIIYHLCAIGRFDIGNSIKLMTTCIRRLTDQIAEIDIIELQKIISRLVSTTSDQFSPFQFHLHSLLKCYAERIAQEDAGLSAALALQQTIKRINFQSIALLRYIGDKMISNVDACSKMNLFEIFTIVQAFANNLFIPQTDSNQQIWSDCIVPAILANDNLSKVNFSSTVWLPFTLQLAILGHFEQKFISHVLSMSYLTEYFLRKEFDVKDLQKVLILYQTVSMQPHIDLKNVDLKAIIKQCNKYRSQLTASDFNECLIDHVGESRVLTNVRTKHLHFIPTLVKLNKQNGDFVTFSNHIQRDENGFILLDSIPCDDNEILVCVDSVKRFQLFANALTMGRRDVADEMKIGQYRLRAKQLEELGLTVCDINYRRFKIRRPKHQYRLLQENIINCVMKTEPYNRPVENLVD